MSEKFESAAAANPEKYIGSVADCGDKKLNEPHLNACIGLRNLRLQSLEQTEAIVERLEKRRKNITELIFKANGTDPVDKAGQLQRYQFELQDSQAHMQNDAMQLEATRYGYKQREKTYEMQMVETKRVRDTVEFHAFRFPMMSNAGLHFPALA